ncbi:MAG: PDZ domain-containing protein, partial [Planctomycetota bacterium]
HLSFMSRKVPALFAIDLTSERSHPDYHTSRDTLDKINRVSAVQAIDLWNAILSAVAVHPQPIEWQDKSDEPEEDEPRASIGTIKVSFGIRPDMDEYDDSKVEIGIGVASVTEGSPAEQAGVQAGDVLLRWNGAKITDITEWMQMLATHEVGDEVAVGVKRNGEELTLTATLAESTRGR